MLVIPCLAPLGYRVPTKSGDFTVVIFAALNPSVEALTFSTPCLAGTISFLPLESGACLVGVNGIGNLRIPGVCSGLDAAILLHGTWFAVAGTIVGDTSLSFGFFKPFSALSNLAISSA